MGDENSLWPEKVPEKVPDSRGEVPADGLKTLYDVNQKYSQVIKWLSEENCNYNDSV